VGISGEKHNRLTVIKKTSEKRSNSYLWLCKCDCGNKVKLRKWNITSGNTKSCGCLKNESIARIGRRNINDLAGKRFERLVVIERSETIKYDGGTRIYWLCKCECGNKKKVRGSHLTSNKVRSCGCLEKENLNNLAFKETHGLSDERLYTTWKNMISRCTNPNHVGYKNYGGRGITVCDEWINSLESFYKWAMNNGYEEGLTIDRINNDGNYEPSNCRWATYKQQANNKRTSPQYQ